MPAHRTLREIVTWGPKITEITESQRRLSLKSDLKPNAIFTDHFTSINWIKTYAEADGGCIQEFRGAIPTITEITTCPRMIPAHKGDDGGREWRPGYVGWYHRLSQQYLWRSDSTRMIPVHVQGRQREQKPNMVIPVGDSLSGSAKAVPAGHKHVLFSSFLLPPLNFIHWNNLRIKFAMINICWNNPQIGIVSSPLGPLSGFLDSWMHLHPFQHKSSIHHLIHHSISS